MGDTRRVTRRVCPASSLASRAPRTLRAHGAIMCLQAIAATILGPDRARAVLEWEAMQGPTMQRRLEPAVSTWSILGGHESEPTVRQPSASSLADDRDLRVYARGDHFASDAPLGGLDDGVDAGLPDRRRGDARPDQPEVHHDAPGSDYQAGDASACRPRALTSGSRDALDALETADRGAAIRPGWGTPRTHQSDQDRTPDRGSDQAGDSALASRLGSHVRRTEGAVGV